MAGLSGSLVSRHYAEHGLPSAFDGQLGEADRDGGRRQLRNWSRSASAALGPASSLRTMFDCGASPLMRILGYEPGRLAVPGGREPLGHAPLGSAWGSPAALLVCPWGVDPGRSWRDVVRVGIRVEARWCFVFNGRVLRLVDAVRTFARRHLEVDLEAAVADDRLFRVLWGVLHARAVAGPDGPGRSLADRVFQASDAHRAGVRASLGDSVRSSLVELLNAFGGRGAVPQPARDALFEQSLVVIYRILFLLFAEARGLVPVWHPIYRGSYSLDTLARRAERDREARGLWESLQAVTRLAGRGCEAGDLRVTPFNGRLFARAAAARFDARPRRRRGRRRTHAARDRSIGQVLVALTTRRSGEGPAERIAYADLGVEQLGAVYERVLDDLPAPSEPGGCRLRLEPGGRRKTTGSFYTPRALTAYLVRRTLHPLVEGATPEAVLSVRVLDPAMGSGAFLVEACRYLASAYETSLVRSGARTAADITPGDRAAFRRAVAQRCLYGVDSNPMAVQLARLSLWLATLAADRPLTFLDHNLRAGDSLVGASMDDVLRQPPAAGHRTRTAGALPLFDTVGLETALAETVAPRARIATEPGDDLRAVRDKERAFAGLTSDKAPLARWRAVFDLWCAASFWPSHSRPPRSGEFRALADHLLGADSALPARLAGPRLAEARRIAVGGRFFHWPLEFPEAFRDASGLPRSQPGFDAVVGNPPWEMLRADPPAGGRAGPRDEVVALKRFARASGIYRLLGDGHTNLYQLFVERALRLTRRGGRVGLVLPFGLAVDRGAAGLRAELLGRCDTDALVSFDNAEGIFPIHRGYRFLLITTTVGGETRGMRCRFGERSAGALDLVPDAGGDARAFPVRLGRAAVAHVGGAGLAIPELRTAADLAIAEKASTLARPLGDPDGWGARFGRELNATDDRRHFGPPGCGLPVIEGKLVRPFAADVGRARQSLPEETADRLLVRARTFGRRRLAFRDIASPTNERSLIAAVLPPGVVTTHTLLCLKTCLDEEDQLVLCALLNSLVANYLVRQRMGTHVTATIAEALPVPRPTWGSAAYGALADCARRLATEGGDVDAIATLETTAARLYGLSFDELAHVLEAFPLVDRGQREAVLETFRPAASSRT